MQAGRTFLFVRQAPACYDFIFILFLTTGFFPGSSVTWPPAFSIFSRADLLKRWAETLSFFVNSPLPTL